MNINISPARIQAYKALCDVINNKAFSNIAVNRHINLCLKNIPDRNLSVNIVYGTLKKTFLLENILSGLSSKPFDGIDPNVRVILIMSLYQLLFLDKTPKYAVVNDAVEMCKLYKMASASSFVNGILRNALRKSESFVLKHSEFEDVMHYDCNFPLWLTKLLVKDYSRQRLMSIANAFEAPARVYIRVNTLKTSGEKLIDSLAKDGITAESTYVPNALRITRGASIFASKAFKNGEFYAQDLSGVISGYALSPSKNDTILDICAAPGGKTFNASILSGSAPILACDINTAKLDMLKRSAAQLSLENITAVKRDATGAVSEGNKSLYSRVICDVPCSGLGVVGRKPEILTNITKTHIDNLMGIQKAILCRAADYLSHGGTLLYSTCTINKGENHAVIEKALSERNDLELSPIRLGFELNAAHEETKNGYLSLYPNIDECDGFFMAKITKK